MLILVRPSLEYLSGYSEALQRDWGPDTQRMAESAKEHLQEIAKDPAAFLASLDDVEGRGPPVTLADGSKVPRLPGFNRWMWDESFCGSINFRWQKGTPELPPHVLGHIGYSVVPWMRGRGYAKKALALLLPDARALGLSYVELTTEVGNIASQRVIESNGGKPTEKFRKPGAHGGAESLRYRIAL